MKTLILQNIEKLLQDLVKDEFVNISEIFITKISHLYHDAV